MSAATHAQWRIALKYLNCVQTEWKVDFKSSVIAYQEFGPWWHRFRGRGDY